MSEIQLRTEDDIDAVLQTMSLEEKLALIGQATACTSRAFAQLGIESLRFMDGATGINGVQAVLDYITDPEVIEQLDDETRQQFAYASDALVALNTYDIDLMRQQYADNPAMHGLVEALAQLRPDGRQHMSFPSGIGIGATFDSQAAHNIGQAVGSELASAGIDVCMGPNIDIFRDPRSGRGYEMYGEDPQLVGGIAQAFIGGMQQYGVAATVKHFLANSQETQRNTRNEHIDPRTLHELYARPFERILSSNQVPAVMAAYNVIEGVPTSMSARLLTDLLRTAWGFNGAVISDWGGANPHRADAIAAGLDLITCGPQDMHEVQEAVEQGNLSAQAVDQAVRNMLHLVLWCRRAKASAKQPLGRQAVQQISIDTIAQGSVLLKNDRDLLPIQSGIRVGLFGSGSAELFECGDGSTKVITALHGDVPAELDKVGLQVDTTGSLNAIDAVVYVATATSGENVDRADMCLSAQDEATINDVLRQAKEQSIPTIVVLNVAGPIDMSAWQSLADAVLCIFVPGCMGAQALAQMLIGEQEPSGRLPVTFPQHVQDAPSYLTFPGEGNDIVYSEGIFVGYRGYDRRNIEVAYPFGYGLGYGSTTCEFVDNNDLSIDTRTCESFSVPIRVTNISSHATSAVIQLYSHENTPRVMRPDKELVGYTKIFLEPGQSVETKITCDIRSLRYWDSTQEQLIQPVGEHTLMLAWNARDIIDTRVLHVTGSNPYPLNGQSTMAEIFAYPPAMDLVNNFTQGMLAQISDEQKNFMVNMTLDSILSAGMIQVIPDAVAVRSALDELYRQLAQL